MLECRPRVELDLILALLICLGQLFIQRHQFHNWGTSAFSLPLNHLFT